MASDTVEDNNTPDDDDTEPSPRFKPINRTGEKSALQLPDELWVTVLESPCTFPQEAFYEVMLNLIKNPNITSSHLFRADIFYDSDKDHAVGDDPLSQSSLLKGLKRECQPMRATIPEFDCQRKIVRQLIPRNPQLDRPLVQTCHVFSSAKGDEDRTVVLYIPHVQQAEDMPFYHPTVARLAFEHVSHSSGGFSISISYSLFPEHTLTTKLERTALKLLQTVHKHGQGQLAGYQKRVHHDQVISQKRYQDTYTKLKAKYGKQLSEQWVEVTDPGKHVFEDLGIAAFLIELWRDMYSHSEGHSSITAIQGNGVGAVSKPPFPGFVDIGCGNGILVSVLLAEGYEGWGFDARARKTWSIFPDHVQAKLEQKLLIPRMFTPDGQLDEFWHSGVFKPGTFIISNHADELTAWTPSLAFLNDSSFIAIPCCSHDLAGARFRAPPATKSTKAGAPRLAQQQDTNGVELRKGAAETGSLKRTEAQKKMPSAYSTLCSYVTSLAEEVGFEPEHEVLRIPSTRNQCIIGRRKRQDSNALYEVEGGDKEQVVVGIVERELDRGIDTIGMEWIKRAGKLAKKPGSGH